MKGAFEGATRVAIEEIIKNRAHTSKFGLILTEQTLVNLVDDLLDLLMTSRSLKAGGDKLLKAGLFNLPSTAPKSKSLKGF